MKTMKTMKTMQDVYTRIADIFSAGIICKMTHMEITDRLIEKVMNPLNERTRSGRRKHSIYLVGYAQGVIDKYRKDIWQYHVEFCYLIDGTLYSTHKRSTRPTTEQIYASNRGHILADSPSAHYWKDSDKVY